MITKSTRLNALVSVIFFSALAACGDTGGCGCAGYQPVTQWNYVPVDQTVEGGGQVRVTQAGFQKLTSIVPGFLNDQLDGFCLPQGELLDASFTGADYCYTNQGGACGAGRGCAFDFNTDYINLSVNSPADVLNIDLQLDAIGNVPLDGAVVFIPFSCSIDVNANNIQVNVDIGFDIDATTGELNLHLEGINNTDFSNVSFNGCSIVSDIANALVGLLDSFVGDFLIDLLTPTIDDLVQGFLPDPLGIQGVIDSGALVGGVSPGTEATLEVRMVPGGYVDLRGGGMSLGLITGFNADEDPATRTPDLDSEPSYCVPPIPAPNFAAPPASLPATARGTFALQPANEFIGAPEPADDLAIGLSETTLDLAGHHLVTSGTMCLGVGTSLIPQLNLGTFGLLVASLGELGDSGNPVLLVTRPQRALDFTIGDGTEESPSLTIGIQDFEADLYAFIYERYVRAFTLKLDMNVGVNLEFDQQPGMPATVTPTLIGLDADNITVEVLNAEFVRESQADLEAVLPTIFDLAVGLLGDGLGSIEVPEFAGFTLNNLRTQHVLTSEDDFLAIYASLGTSAAMLELGEQFPSMRPALENLQAPMPPAAAPAPDVRVVGLDVPAPETTLAALKGEAGGALPTISLAVPARDAMGRELEHAWRLAGGMWRPFRTGDTLTIVDRALAWQGKYTVEVKSRVKGDYRTTSAPVALPVIIDSVGPEVLLDQVTSVDGVYTAPARDVVSASVDLQWAFGRPGDQRPATDWQRSPSIALEAIDDLFLDAQLAVWVKDEAGNVSVMMAPAPFHGQAGESGCSCEAGHAPSTGGLVLVMLTGAGLVLRRRRLAPMTAAVARAARRHAGTIALGVTWLGLSALVPACNCGSNPGEQACETTEECTEECPDGQLPYCNPDTGTCTCISDVPWGRIGPYSDVAVDSQGNAWISAYNESHGDLMVGMYESAGRVPDERFEFVDGVPDGPVAIPGSEVRGGILTKGPDVGGYTSIAVAPDDTPIVTYFDYDEGSLKYAAKYGGTWQIHTIDDGTGEIDPELGGEIAGWYSALTLRSDDGRPGVAYMAQVSSGAGVISTEVRFAAAQSAQPTSQGDWVFWTIETVTLPPADPEATPDPTPIPQGAGLFIDATRDAAQAPAVAYYDRVNGDLKVARFDATAGTFLAPEVIDGADGADVGWYPSLQIDAAGVAHVTYLSATRDDLLYVNSDTLTPEVVDDGYRIVGQTEDGLPKPEFHFVGDDSSLIMSGNGPVVVYQDATSHELLYSAWNPTTMVWNRRAIAGAEAEFVGAYGFFASAVMAGDEVVISNWVIDQPHNDQWVEIHRERIDIE